MKQTIPQEFESLCLMIEMGFYYKDSSQTEWKNFDELTSIVVDKAVSGRDRAGLLVLRNYLDALLNQEHPEEELSKVWKSTRPRVAFFDGAGASADKQGIVYLFKLVRAAIEKKLTAMGKE